MDEDDHLTSDGEWASQLRIDQPLLVAEALRLGLFPNTDPGLFAAVIAAFVNEKESDERVDRHTWPKDLVKSVLRVKKGLVAFSRHMTFNGFPVRTLYAHPAAAVHAWARGDDWKVIVQQYRMQDGDFSMLIMRTADNLRHIRSLSHAFPETAVIAQQAINLIMRVPVTPEY